MKNILIKTGDFLLFLPKKTRIIINILLIAFIPIDYFLIYRLGGSKYGYSQTVYILVLMLSISMGLKGGILGALISSIMILPNLSTHYYSEEIIKGFDIGYTIFIYFLVGALSGYATDTLRKNRLRIIDLLSFHHQTRIKLYNAIPEVDKLASKEQMVFILRVINFQQIVDHLGIQEYFKHIKNVYREVAESRVLNGGFYQIEDKTFIYITDYVNNKEKKETLLHVLKKSYQMLDVPINFDYAIGCSKGNIPLDDLVEEAYVASRFAEENDQTYASYKKSQEESHQSFLLVSEFYEAMKNHDLMYVYQPIYNQHKETVAIEALVRWIHPEKGMLYPGDFIEMIEQTQIINDLTIYLCRHVKNQVLPELNHHNVRISLNISTKNLMNDFVMDKLISDEIFSHSQKQKIVLEVTESHMVKNHDALLEGLLKLKNAGYKIALDDFGTGYSNLTYLHKYPLDYIKIDRSFILEYDDSTIKNIVHTAIELSHIIGCKVIAEGVETKEVFDKLKKTGCDFYQGFYLSKPKTIEEVVEQI